MDLNQPFLMIEKNEAQIIWFKKKITWFKIITIVSEHRDFWLF